MRHINNTAIFSKLNYSTFFPLSQTCHFFQPPQEKYAQVEKQIVRMQHTYISLLIININLLFPSLYLSIHLFFIYPPAYYFSPRFICHPSGFSQLTIWLLYTPFIANGNGSSATAAAVVFLLNFP